MPVIEESIVISRPAVEVFEFLTEPENVLLYSSNVVEYEQVSGAPRDVGGVRRCRWGRRGTLRDDSCFSDRLRCLPAHRRTPKRYWASRSVLALARLDLTSRARP